MSVVLVNLEDLNLLVKLLKIAVSEKLELKVEFNNGKEF